MYPALRHLHCVMGETKIQNQKSNYRISKCNIFQSTWERRDLDCIDYDAIHHSIAMLFPPSVSFADSGR